MIGKKFKYKTFFLIVLGGLILSNRASAWGLLNGVDSEEVKTFLPGKILKNREIKYCINIDDPSKFERQSIDLQVRYAFKLWLKSANLEITKLTSISCIRNDIDVMIDIGVEREYLGIGGFGLRILKEKSTYTYIRIDTGYSYYGYQIKDFKTLLPESVDLEHTLNALSNAQMTFDDLYQLSAVDSTQAYWSTYRLFIHEFGHAFSLCDTYAPEVRKCSPNHSSKTHPSSVMQDSMYFYLTPDDEAGIRHAFDFYGKLLASEKFKNHAILPLSK